MLGSMSLPRREETTMKQQINTNKRCLGIAVSVMALFAWPALAHGQVLNPDNGHYYDFVSDGLTWGQANTAAMGQQFMGQNGTLVSITSASEQSFVLAQFGAQFPGAFATTPVWLGGFQPNGSVEPAGGFQWVTGEPFVYTNWDPNEPNNNGNENVIEIRNDGFWNDTSENLTGSGYVVEFVPEPSTYVLSVLGGLAFLLARSKRRDKRVA